MLRRSIQLPTDFLTRTINPIEDLQQESCDRGTEESSEVSGIKGIGASYGGVCMVACLTAEFK